MALGMSIDGKILPDSCLPHILEAGGIRPGDQQNGNLEEKQSLQIVLPGEGEVIHDHLAPVHILVPGLEGQHPKQHHKGWNSGELKPGNTAYISTGIRKTATRIGGVSAT